MVAHVIQRCVGAAGFVGLVAACAPPAAAPVSVCLVSAEHAAVRDVTVRVANQRLPLQLDAARVSATLSAERAQAALEVHHPLRFETLHPREALDLRVKAPVTQYEGRVVLGAGFKLTEFRIRGAHLESSLERNLQVGTVPAVQLPCSALTLAAKDARYASPKRRRPAEAQWASLGPGPVPLYRSPGTDDPITVEHRGPFQLLQQRGPWAHVRADWEDGSRIAGWVPAEAMQDEVQWLGAWAQGFETAGGCSTTDLPRRQRVEVAAEAAIAASPGGAVWAHFAERQWVTVFAPRTTQEWLAVASIPGITLDSCAATPYTWIRSQDIVQYQAGAP